MDVLFIAWTTFPKERIYEDPSVWYRCFQPADALRKIGVRAYVTHFEDVKPKSLAGLKFAVFFRPQFSDQFVELFEEVSSGGAFCLASYDDLFFDVSLLRRSNFRSLDAPQTEILKTRPYNYAQALYFFDAFIVSTDPMHDILLEAHPSSRVHTLYNAVSPEMLSLAEAATSGMIERVPGRIGYFAGGRSHSIDLARVAEQIASVLETTDSSFFCVETVDIPAPILKTQKVQTTKRLTYMGMIQAYASCCVTIAPLELDVFTSSKSGIKYLEACSVGAASVATPIPDIMRVADERLIPVHAPAEWPDGLRQALEFPVNRSTTIQQQRRLRDQFSTSVEATRLMRFFETMEG